MRTLHTAFTLDAVDGQALKHCERWRARAFRRRGQREPGAEGTSERGQGPEVHVPGGWRVEGRGIRPGLGLRSRSSREPLSVWVALWLVCVSAKSDVKS